MNPLDIFSCCLLLHQPQAEHSIQSKDKATATKIKPCQGHLEVTLKSCPQFEVLEFEEWQKSSLEDLSFGRETH